MIQIEQQAMQLKDLDFPCTYYVNNDYYCISYVNQTLNSLIMHSKSFSTGSYLEGNQ